MITFPSFSTILSNRHSLTLSLSEGVDADVTVLFRADSQEPWRNIWDGAYHTIDGKVTLYDIGQLVGDQLGSCIVGQVKLEVTERDYDTRIVEGQKNYTAMLCECEEAEDVLDDGFLTMFRGLKTTFIGAKEEVYFHQQGTTTYEVLGEYLTPENNIELVSFPAIISTMTGVNAAIKRIDMSPDHFVAANKILVHLTLRVDDGRGVHNLEWRVTDKEPTTRMMFRNSFGLPEVMCFFGAETRDIEQERSSALVEGYNRNYRVQDKTKFTADTGIMTQGMALLAEDLMRTEECYILDEGNSIRKEIRITGGKAKRTSEDAETPRFEIEYENARLQFRSRGNDYSAARIFDDSFDLKFN